VKAKPGIRILLFTEHPFVAIGLASAVRAARGFVLAGCCDSLAETMASVPAAHPDVILLHLSPRVSLSDISSLRSLAGGPQILLWSDGIGEEFAFQAMQLGVRAILPGSTSIDGLLAAIENVHRGVMCFEKELVDRVLFRKRVSLTRREGQIVTLVAQGCKNKAIGETLGITEGTVKVYLYKLFKKLGVNDRLDMALYGIQHLFGGRPPMPGIDVPYGPRTLPPRSERPPSEAMEWRRVN
jgi:DNA-binding NarL/FixJ family response regulator